MDVGLTPEQDLWRDAVARLAARYAAEDPRQPSARAEQGWSEVIDLGIPALASPDDAGTGATCFESLLAVEEIASRLTRLPVLGQAVLVPRMLQAAGAIDLLGDVITGRRRFAPAFDATLQRFGRLGEDLVVFDAADASHALLFDRAGDGTATVVLIALEDPPRAALDLTRMLSRLDGSAQSVGGTIETCGVVQAEALTLLDALALAALSADLLGVMEGALGEAVAYARSREQFGQAIGAFQSIQHLLADAAVSVEGARGCTWHAAWSLDHLGAQEALASARVAKGYASDAALRVVEVTTQVHAGVAFTWDHPSHLRLRRVHLDRQCFGAEDVQWTLIGSDRITGAVG